MTGRNVPTCKCGDKMLFIPANEAWWPNKRNGVRCHGCSVQITTKELVWHCDREQARGVHEDGFDLCRECGAALIECNGSITRMQLQAHRRKRATSPLCKCRWLMKHNQVLAIKMDDTKRKYEEIQDMRMCNGCDLKFGLSVLWVCGFAYRLCGNCGVNQNMKLLKQENNIGDDIPICKCDASMMLIQAN